MSVRNLLEVSHLSKTYGSGKRAILAVDDVSFSVREGSTLGILGESGSGKSTIGRCILRLIEPDSGELRFNGENLTFLSLGEFRQRRRHMQMIFQNTSSSLNAKMTVGENIRDPLDIWGIDTPIGRTKKVRELLDVVGLREKSVDAYPWELSGGQQQRVSIARALALEPKLLIFDEATSSLDVSVQTQIINLLVDLQRELGLTYIMISHNLGVVEYMSDEVLVMKEGKMCELSTTEEIYKFPKSSYTRSLIHAIPKIPSLELLQARAERWEQKRGNDPALEGGRERESL